MDAKLFESGIKFLDKWERSDLSRFLSVNVELIEIGLETLRSQGGSLGDPSEDPIDALWGKDKIEDVFPCKWETIKKFMKSNGFEDRIVGDAKGFCVRRSTVLEVLDAYETSKAKG